MIEIEDLRVRFGGVTPIDGMTMTFPQGNGRARAYVVCAQV